MLSLSAYEWKYVRRSQRVVPVETDALGAATTIEMYRRCDRASQYTSNRFVSLWFEYQRVVAHASSVI